MLQTIVIEKIKKNTFYVKTFFNCTVYEIMWKNMAEPDKPQMSLYTACTLHAG